MLKLIAMSRKSIYCDDGRPVSPSAIDFASPRPPLAESDCARLSWAYSIAEESASLSLVPSQPPSE